MVFSRSKNNEEQAWWNIVLDLLLKNTLYFSMNFVGLNGVYNNILTET